MATPSFCAASYPQSTVAGSQYAHCRAINRQPFENGQWVAIATTFDPETSLLTAYRNGVAVFNRVLSADELRELSFCDN